MKTPLKTMKIHGKDYVTVNSRIEYFRVKYPEGRITTQMLPGPSDSICIFKASVYRDEKTTDACAIGHAYEKAGSSQINKTSHIENCETSAIGRALGILGIGIAGSVTSAEEVENAVNQQVDQATTTEAEDNPRKDINQDCKRWDLWKIPFAKSDNKGKTLGELTLTEPAKVTDLFTWCEKNWDLDDSTSKAGKQRQASFKFISQAVDEINKMSVESADEETNKDARLDSDVEDEIPF